jgi:hypothetical protein
MTALAKRDIDVSKVFLAYLSLQGDVNRTALACDMAVEDVRDLAVQEHWATKIDQFAALREQDNDFQVSLNRVLNYVQSRQLSGLVDAVLRKLSDPGELMNALTVTTATGSSFSTKPITDLVRAAEMIQNMTARALGDTGAPADEKKAGGNIGVNVARALNAVAQNRGVDAVTITKKSLELPNADAGRNSSPTPPATP